MMRAALILASVSTLSAMELATPPRSVKAVNEPAIQSMVGIDVSRDTLTKIDRLEFPYALYEVPTRPIPFIERMPSAIQSLSLRQRHLRSWVDTGRSLRRWLSHFRSQDPRPKKLKNQIA